LADNGTLFWWGHALKIAYSQIILDKYFNLLSSIVWDKFDAQTNKNSPESMRSFAPVTERLLMYDNGEDVSGLTAIYSDAECFKSIKEYMRSERAKLMQERGFKTLAEFDNFINEWTNTKSVVSRHYFADSQYSFPTAEIYARMQQTGFWQLPYEALRQEYEALRQEYEALRQEYEALRRPFNQSKLQTDILRYSQEAHITKQHDHPTKKPERLTAALITTCSREKDLVLVPFAGSGTEVAMAAKYGRKFVGFDIEQKYAQMSQQRADKFLNQTTLF
jgi:site-specific DNA-methyltransferase (adenine-specific)